MPRLHIYISHNLAMEIEGYPYEINLSKVCSDAIRAELEAAIVGRKRDIVDMFRSVFHEPQGLEHTLMNRLQLRFAVAAKAMHEGETGVDRVADNTARFLDRRLPEGARLAIAGGAQMWNVVRRLAPRNVAVDLWALGFGHVDRQLPHLHPNALVTTLSLLYSPRSRPHLVGERPNEAWSVPPVETKDEKHVRRFILGSCALFDAESPYAQVLGKEITDFLVEENVMGEFCGVFVAPDGRLIEPIAPTMTASHISSADLRSFARREDSIVLMVSAGLHKVKLMRAVIDAGLCNTLITDYETGYALAQAT
jgi:DNA-binding transcriptional regulator LsrR (DeoR family)